MENTLLSRFSQSVKNYSDDVFFIEAETQREYTFHQFSEDTRRICYYLKSHFEDREVVLLHGENSYLYAVYAMATLLSGKTLFPLNPNEEARLLKKLVEKLTRRSVLFSDEPTTFLSTETFLLEEMKNILPPKDFKTEGPGIGHDLVYMATSATTGESKIVVQGEKALLANIDDLIEHHGLLKRKRIATSLPLFHVNALHFSFFCSLFSGGSLLLLKNFDPRTCFEFIEKYKIQVFSAIPSLLASLSRNSSVSVGYDLSSLDYFVSAAAPLSAALVKDIKKRFGKKIVQGYGLSEAINFSCSLPVDLTDNLYTEIMLNSKFPSIGVALKHNDVVIFDESFNKVGAEVEGEVGIRGQNLMNGYLNTSSEIYFHEGYFLTGDLGFYQNHDGQAYYFISGRKKEIAKILGETVSLREMDEAIGLGAKFSHDFFTVSFDNKFKGEELGVVCKIEAGEDVTILSQNFNLSFNALKSSRRPKVVLFITGKNIRTASGKAKRFSFKDQFREYFDKRFLNQTLFKTI